MCALLGRRSRGRSSSGSSYTDAASRTEYRASSLLRGPGDQEQSLTVVSYLKHIMMVQLTQNTCKSI